MFISRRQLEKINDDLVRLKADVRYLSDTRYRLEAELDDLVKALKLKKVHIPARTEFRETN